LNSSSWIVGAWSGPLPSGYLISLSLPSFWWSPVNPRAFRYFFRSIPRPLLCFLFFSFFLGLGFHSVFPPLLRVPDSYDSLISHHLLSFSLTRVLFRRLRMGLLPKFVPPVSDCFFRPSSLLDSRLAPRSSRLLRRFFLPLSSGWCLFVNQERSPYGHSLLST